MKRSLQLTIFLTIITATLVLGNFVVFKALAITFALNPATGAADSAIFVWLGLALGILSAGFILSIVLGNYFYNWFTRLYSKVSMIWMGFFLYLFLASVVFGLVVIVSVSGQSFRPLGYTLLLAALCAGVYSIFHAKNIKVANISVALPNLPEAWLKRKAVFISDLHLGQLNGSAFAEKIVKKIEQIAPDILFIGGDLFDGTTAPDLAQLVAPLKRLTSKDASSAVPLGVYYVTGNHEEFGDNTDFISAIRDAGILILNDEKVEIDGLQLIGVDYEHASHPEKFREILAGLALNKTKPSILLKHEPRDLNIPEEAGVSLQISGHTHKAQLWPLGYLAQYVYKGFAYGLHAFKDMQVYTSSGVGTWGPPMRLGSDSEIVLMTFSNQINNPDSI